MNVELKNVRVCNVLKQMEKLCPQLKNIENLLHPVNINILVMIEQSKPPSTTYNN